MRTKIFAISVVLIVAALYLNPANADVARTIAPCVAGHTSASTGFWKWPANSHVNIYDANGWGLRSTAGVVPGAHLLTSDDKYDVAKELSPAKNAKLVFYCADLH